jgi:hypothetical protein
MGDPKKAPAWKRETTLALINVDSAVLIFWKPKASPKEPRATVVPMNEVVHRGGCWPVFDLGEDSHKCCQGDTKEYEGPFSKPNNDHKDKVRKRLLWLREGQAWGG